MQISWGRHAIVEKNETGADSIPPIWSRRMKAGACNNRFWTPWSTFCIIVHEEKVHKEYLRTKTLIIAKKSRTSRCLFRFPNFYRAYASKSCLEFSLDDLAVTIPLIDSWSWIMSWYPTWWNWTQSIEIFHLHLDKDDDAEYQWSQR